MYVLYLVYFQVMVVEIEVDKVFVYRIDLVISMVDPSLSSESKVEREHDWGSRRVSAQAGDRSNQCMPSSI